MAARCQIQALTFLGLDPVALPIFVDPLLVHLHRARCHMERGSTYVITDGRFLRPQRTDAVFFG